MPSWSEICNVPEAIRLYNNIQDNIERRVMPSNTYGIPEAGMQALQEAPISIDAAIGRASQAGATTQCNPNRASRVTQQYPQAPFGEPGAGPPESYPISAMPFPYGSWETMTNVEKFNRLRQEIRELTEEKSRLGSELYKLQGLLEQHQHNPLNGGVLVQYNRDRY